MHSNGVLRRWTRSLTAAAIATATMGAALLTVSTGSPAASAATRQVAAPARLSWHTFKLLNDWTSAESVYHTGAPRWAVSHGIVYLAGSVRETSPQSVVIGQLPRAAWPARALGMQVYTFKGIPTDLQITADGTVLVIGSSPPNAQQITSLAGASYPARATARHRLSLLHGWTTMPGSWHAGYPSYSLIDGIVHLSGAIRQPSGSNPMFARLPAGLRPAHVLYITIDTGNNDPGVLQILPTGAMYAGDGQAQQYSTLDGVTFPVASVSNRKLTLVGGWKSSQGIYSTGNPSYAVRVGVVYLSGSLHHQVSSGGLICTLPKALRPGHDLFFITYAVDGTTGFLEIAPSGQVWADSNPGSNSASFTSLASISFPLGS
jgi:hypothetical protein